MSNITDPDIERVGGDKVTSDYDGKWVACRVLNSAAYVHINEGVTISGKTENDLDEAKRVILSNNKLLQHLTEFRLIPLSKMDDL